MLEETGARCILLVSGQVQGVGFRAFVLDRARELGLQGWVQNLPDGRVEVLAEGSRAKIENLARSCEKGPSFSQVSSVSMSWEEPKGRLDGFVIRRGPAR